MNIPKIEAVNFNIVHQVLTSNKISESQKIQFLRNNKTEIEQLIDIKEPIPTGKEYAILMKNRPLIKFRPLKNSFKKRGDKILLAKSLGIPLSEVDSYIQNVTEAMSEINQLSFLPEDKIDSIKTYVFRHGSKDQVVSCLEYELMKSKDILKTLYTTLEYHTGGAADYFLRPIHRMDNKTLLKIYNVIDKQLNNAEICNNITKEQNQKIAEWALIRIYKIQNNNKLINAIKTYKTLSQT